MLFFTETEMDLHLRVLWKSCVTELQKYHLMWFGKGVGMGAGLEGTVEILWPKSFYVFDIGDAGVGSSSMLDPHFNNF